MIDGQSAEIGEVPTHVTVEARGKYIKYQEPTPEGYIGCLTADKYPDGLGFVQEIFFVRADGSVDLNTVNSIKVLNLRSDKERLQVTNQETRGFGRNAGPVEPVLNSRTQKPTLYSVMKFQVPNDIVDVAGSLAA